MKSRSISRAQRLGGILLLLFGVSRSLAGVQSQSIATPTTETGVAARVQTNSPSVVQLEQLRTELARLGDTNTPGTDLAISAWLDRLIAGQVAKQVQFDVLEAAGKHSSPGVKEKVGKYRAARLEEGGLATVSELLYGGNAELGKKIFFEKPDTSCSKCHKVGRLGGETGPSLTATATNRTREFILESILNPSANITPGYETAIVVLKNRTGYNGTLKGEDEAELRIDCDPDGIISVKKADIQSRRKGPSPMPEGLPKGLTDRDLRDLVEFVATLTTNTEVAPLPQGQNSELVQRGK